MIEIAIRPRDVQLANQIFRATWSGRKDSRNYSRMLYYSFHSATRSGSKDLIGLIFLILNSHTTKSLLTVVQWYSRHLFFVVKGMKVGNNDEETILLQFNLEQKGLK